MNDYILITPEPSPFTCEDCDMQLKDPGKAISGLLVKTIWTKHFIPVFMIGTSS